ncbi:mucin-2-like [Aedes albopictus]|uniref:Uncharacterized protein n=1 Tax=Aedes albopictus TaxID=7160 RepID=A0ABM2A5D6_AEDAL|nr:uncharacterized protein DDB_G0290587-like [Aedes albopictus]
MDWPRIILIVGLWLPSIQAATDPVDQTLMFKEIDSLLRRCPCVPINTCYSQGVSLNEQNFLNTNFECDDHTYNHCCGPYFQTLGNEDFYFDENGFDRQGAWRKPPETLPSNIMIIMPPDATTESPETLTKVVLVYPETTTKPTTSTEAAEEPTTEETTSEPFIEDVETTPMDEETSTELVTTTTTDPTTITSRTTLSPQQQRLSRLQNRPPYPTRIRSTRPSTTTTTTTTTTTEPTTTTPRFSTIRIVPKPDSRHRQAMNRLRLFVRTSTTPSSDEYEDDYGEDDDEEENEDDGTKPRDTNTAAEEDDGEDEL